MYNLMFGINTYKLKQITFINIDRLVRKYVKMRLQFRIYKYVCVCKRGMDSEYTKRTFSNEGFVGEYQWWGIRDRCRYRSAYASRPLGPDEYRLSKPY